MPFWMIRFFSEYGAMILPASGGIIVSIMGALAWNWKKAGKFLKTAGLGLSVLFALLMMWYVSENMNGAFHIEDALFPDDYPSFYRDSYYVGQVKNGQAIGEGKLFDAKSSRLVYSGSFENNRISQGTRYYDNGDSYTGAFQDNKKSGQGAYSWADAASSYARYEGAWKSGNYNGWGVMYFSSQDNRERYEGMWVNDICEGHGTLYWKDGGWYDGEWSNNQRNGQGNHHYADGSRYYGEWNNGKKEGYGAYYWTDGSRYEGEWANDERTGQGTCYWADGSYYTGQWANGVRHGSGAYYYADGTSEAQEWQNGERIS